jgi:hypothetical protein
MESHDRDFASRHQAPLSGQGLTGTIRISLTPQRKGPLCCHGRGLAGTSGSKHSKEKNEESTAF